MRQHRVNLKYYVRSEGLVCACASLSRITEDFPLPAMGVAL
jgi:hypothetical protein